MADRTFIAYNGATAALTGALASVSTGTSLKTMMQLKSSGQDITVTAWGYSFDVIPTAMVKVELVDTGTVNATMATAYNSGDIVASSVPGGTAASLTLSTAASGFTASSEGTVTSTRLLRYREEWGQSYEMSFPLGREPSVAAANYLRIRATTTVAINMVCWIEFDQ